ncbi:hypothetical protein JHK87_052816 [Glycine soja]|nr:hypothetical protein JHK87_052816 [Glycine soja]
MNYLHQMRPPIVYRDLKSPNLLVDDSYIVKFICRRRSHSLIQAIMAAANAPIAMREALTLPSIDINPQFITFTHVTMESDKYICV